MTDPFALLGLPRRPWLNETVIRAAFQEQSRRLHPDIQGGDSEAFAALNAAYGILMDPTQRLRLLAVDAPIPTMPADSQFGFRVGDVMRKVDEAVQKANSTTNVLSRALLAVEAGKIRREFSELMVALESYEAALETHLRELDVRWPEVAVAEIATLAVEYAFLSRWQEQMRERKLALEISYGKIGP